MTRVRRVTFIYALLDSAGAPRYVGKSDAPLQRFQNHLCDKADTHKARWIRSLRASAERPALKVLAVVPFELWQEREREWISALLAGGASLTNSTEGGRGPLEPSQQSRARMRAAKIGRAQTTQHRARVSAALKGKPKPPRTVEHCAALSAACMGRGITPEQRKKLAAANALREARSASGFKGVYFDAARGNYAAHIKFNRRMRHLGRFATDVEAARAYNAAARELGWPEEGLNPV